MGEEEGVGVALSDRVGVRARASSGEATVADVGFTPSVLLLFTPVCTLMQGSRRSLFMTSTYLILSYLKFQQARGQAPFFKAGPP